ncbi:DUF4139 domain-containing protein [Persicitalea jodogahamensis]|uniref:Mucoidy inhibitor MuiA family protein n=1 Tax=Persicitalea jodogahamensis TaxID=402147 RepID=A0A8J3D273_9BACT|nr:DUF4139 domain-containing protein [Persicitalea jodogahamensis]GHB60086.1 hypothetical protein GCM10007390_12250 [Persicitalea jodogahamensis]
MKKTIVFVALTFFVLTAYSQSTDPQTTSPTLTHATVFLNRAELTATAKATIPSGEQRLIIDNIPLSIDRNSIQVKGSGDAVITGVRFVQNYLQNAPRPKNILQLDDSLRTVQDDIAAAQLSLSVLEEERMLIITNRQLTGTATGVKVADLKEMANFYRERLTDIGAKSIKVKERLKDLQQRENNFKNQLSNWQNSRNRPTGGIEVSLKATTRTALNLELSYVVNGAGWRPIYDLRVKETNAPVALAYKAEVFQNTGQNWDNVKLTLSTSNPALGGMMPTLGVQYVDFPKLVRMQSKGRVNFSSEVVKKEAIPAETAPMALGAPMADVQTTADYTQITANDLSVSFDIALPYDIPSGGQPQLVDVARHEVPANYRHFAIPKLDTDAFLVAQLVDWEKYNLLNGKANVYFQGTYVGETQLITQNTNDTLNVSLGRDKKVVVKRERLNEFSSKRFIGSNIRETVTYRITVRNTKSDAARLTLEDQVPVSQNSDIEVSVEETSGAKYNSETGKLTWDVNLKPNESRTFDIRFEVKYPKGQAVVF